MAATVSKTSYATPSGRVIELDVPHWPGNLAGQHLDVRLTSEDGYQAARSYSIASVGSGLVELAVDRIPDGEVSPYLTMDIMPGDQLEVRGPLGGWFVWREGATEPVQLIGGGSGVVPLMAMMRQHAAAASAVPFRLLYSARTDDDAFYAKEIDDLAGPALDVTWIYTRKGPGSWTGPIGRLTRETLAAAVIPAAENPAVFVCGPTPFVEAVASWLVELGHDPARVKTERFGGA
ncbi:MAG: oxidoreductase [Microbacteriaceae bacterium]|nr:oxidoreductase [Microbacteriaceae bacterium]